MAKSYRTSITTIILMTILSCNQYNGYEISSKDSHLRSSSQHDSSPRDQANYHHYRRSDQHDNHIAQQHRSTTFNSIPKSNKYQGWKPIVSSRSLPAVKYAQKSTPSENQPQYVKSVVTESSPVNNQNRKTDQTTGQAVSFVQKSSDEATVKPSKTPKNKIIKEDDIMWMHYGPVDEDDHLVENLLPSSSTEANLENDINYEKTYSKKQYHSQYRVKQSTKELPKNIYEIIDHSPPTFKPIAESTGDRSSWKGINVDDKMQATETRSSIEAASNNEYSSIDLHNTLQNEFDSNRSAKEEKQPRKSDIYDTSNKERAIKINPSHRPDDKNENEQRYYTRTDTKSVPINVQPTKETPDENDEPDTWLLSYFRAQNYSGKGGKFLGKPIVIAEENQPSPYLTAEYYRRLFDSFSREDRSFDRRSSQNDSSHESKSPEHHSAGNTSTADNQTQAENCTLDRTSCATNSKNKNNLSLKPRRRHHFNIFKFMGIDMKDLMPKTLRTNIYLIKKLLTECYTELQDEDPSPVVCLKKITTKVLDNAVDSEIIKLTDSVSLVKENVTSIVEHESSRSSSSNIDWLSNTLEKISRLFSTHSLRVQLINSQDHKYQIEGLKCTNLCDCLGCACGNKKKCLEDSEEEFDYINET